MSAHRGPNFVYRAYAEDGRLLYVGITVNIKRRMAAHKQSSEWFGEWSRMAIEMVPGRGSALLIESNAIAQEIPAFNKHPGYLHDYISSHQRISYMKQAERRVAPI